ncbi:TetR/AcrR family transcriptional regulator [Pseudomonas migulae]
MNAVFKQRPALCEADIVQAATLLMLDCGYNAMSMRMLAKTLGVHAGSLYYHFPGKVELLEQVLSSVLQRRLDDWKVCKPKRRGALENLNAFVLFHLQRSSAFANEERLFERELRHVDDGLQTRLVALHGRYLGALSEIIVQGIRHGQFQVCNIDLTSQCLLSMISGVTKTVGSVNAMDRSVTESIAMLCRRLMQTQ